MIRERRRWLAGSGDVPVPAVHGFDDEWIVMQYVPPAPPTKEAAVRFGRGLAKLHLRGAEARRHTRIEIPFYTGRRKPVADLVSGLA